MGLKVTSLLLAGILLCLPLQALGAGEDVKGGALGEAFGVEMAAFLSSLGEAREVDDGLYQVSGVPFPHAEFKDYLVAWAPEAGVCGVRAFGPRNESDAFGTATRAGFEAIAAELTTAFGEALTVDEVRDPRPLALWSQELAEGKRTYAKVWRAPAGADFGHGIRAVALSAVGYAGQAAGLAIEYRFTNEQGCSEGLSVGFKGFDLGPTAPADQPIALVAVGEQQQLTAAMLTWFSSIPNSPASRRPDLERMQLASCMADILVQLGPEEKAAIIAAPAEQLTPLMTEAAKANPTMPWRNCR